MKTNRSTKDPGFGVKFNAKTKRIINKDGSFNVKREGIGFSFKNLYQKLTNISWFGFLALIVIFYLSINLVFATIYYLIGVENLIGVTGSTEFEKFAGAFHFSYQTFTTLGYGAIFPVGLFTNLVAAVESMFGFLGFAIATGILYGRFSKPSARLLYSNNAIFTEINGQPSLQFRIANKRNSLLMEMEATILYSSVTRKDDTLNRQYFQLELERSKVLFFPLNWTIVHPINESSPFYNKSKEDLKEEKAELLILIKGFDETFGQVVHSRFSYLYTDFIWNAKFKKPFYTDAEGDVILELHQMHEYDNM